MRCAIVDDRADHRERLAAAVEAYCVSRALDGVCEGFASARAFVRGYRAGRFDVVFLDGYLDDGASPESAPDDASSDGSSSIPALDVASDGAVPVPASDGERSARPSEPATGLTVARWLRAHGYAGPIAFVTVSPDFAVAGYGVDATAYLLKPFSQSDVDAVLDKLLQAPRTLRFPQSSLYHARANVVEFDIGQRAANAIREMPPALAASYGGLYVVADGPSGEAMLRVDMDRLAFCRADRHHVVFHDAYHPAAPALTVRMGFSQVEESLSRWPRFLTCARGYIVNLDAVVGMDGDAFLLSGGARVPVSRRRAAEAKARYADHVFTAMRGDDPASSDAFSRSASSAPSASFPSSVPFPSAVTGSRP